MTTWTPGNREKALEALRIVLGGIDGVVTVRRAPPPRTLNLSDNELPAIFVDDSQTNFTWLDRHMRNLIRTQSAIVLDCHALAPSVQGRHQYSTAATLRNLFARRIMLELADNALLTCQIPGTDDEEVPHVRSIAKSFQLRTVPIPFPYIRFQLIVELDVDDDLDQTVRTEWKNAILEVQPERPGEDLPSAIEVTFPALSLRDYFRVEHIDNVLGLWEFDGARVNDLGNHGNDLEVYQPDGPSSLARQDGIYPGAFGSRYFGGAVAWRRLVDGDAADFDNPRDAYELANIGRADSFSVVVACKRGRDTGADQALAGWSGPSGAYWQLYTNDDGETRMRMLGNDDGNTELDAGAGSSEIGDVTLHVAVVDRTADELRLYQNGALVSTTSSLTASVGGLEAAAGALFGVGATATGPTPSDANEDPTAVDDPFHGRMQTACVLSGTLELADVQRMADIMRLADADFSSDFSSDFSRRG